MLRKLKQLLLRKIADGQIETRENVKLRLACSTNTGHKRLHNEDNFLFFGQVMPEEHQSLDHALSADSSIDELTVVAVFDGMGGELAGEAASYAAALALRDAIPSLEPSTQAVGSAFVAMQQAVCDARASRRLSTMGTTAVLFVSQNGTAIVGNLGDSSGYLLRDDSLTSLTIAHTDEAIFRELGIDQKPGLTQYLGVSEEFASIEPHLMQLELQQGDYLLLATDGLTDLVDDEGIADALRRAASPADLVENLTTQALAAGGHDNITLVACEVVAAPTRYKIGTRR